MLGAWYLSLVYVGCGSWFITGCPGVEERNVAAREEEKHEKEEEKG